MNAVMDAKTHACGACRATVGLCVAHKSPLTNRIRRHFARIKAGRMGFGPIMVTAADCATNRLRRRSRNRRRSRSAQETLKETLRRREVTPGIFRRRKSGHFKDESQVTSRDAQDISQAKVRTRRGRRPGRSCRPPFHFRLRHAHANDAPFPPRSPARRCDRPSGRSEPRG